MFTECRLYKQHRDYILLGVELNVCHPKPREQICHWPKLKLTEHKSMNDLSVGQCKQFVQYRHNHSPAMYVGLW